VMAHESTTTLQVLPVEEPHRHRGIVRDVYCMARTSRSHGPAAFRRPGRPNAAACATSLRLVDGIAQYGNALGVPPTAARPTSTPARRQLPGQRGAFGVVEESGIIRSRVPEEAKHVPMT